MDWYLHRRLGARKQALFADLPPVVVELGVGRGCFDALPRARQPPHRHRTEPARARRTAPQRRALRDRPRDPRGTGRVDRSRERERRRGDLHARAVHGGGPSRGARGSAPHPASGRTFRVHRARRVRSGSAPSNAAAVASPVAIRLRRLLPRPRHRGRDRGAGLRGRADRARTDSVALFVPVWPQISGVAVA